MSDYTRSLAGCCPASGSNVDTGQGCWNAKRVGRQAEALAGYVQTLAAGDPDILVLGDLNAHGAEDPILTLTGGGLRYELLRVPAAERYTYVFNGEAGYLDQALATAALAWQVAGVTVWHINADEPSVLDYNTEFKTQDLYQPSPYRSSDHDPVVVGLRLGVKTLFLPVISR
ncbi:MAG: endonuclease/exonuclease/phosphatase family protein [Nitrososphaerales archaeon]